MISAAILAAAPAGGGGGYTGPLDIVPGAVVAYSQRAMAASWTSNAITIRRDSDDAINPFGRWNGPYAEYVMWGTIPSAPQRLAIRQNIAAYYGITIA